MNDRISDAIDLINSIDATADPDGIARSLLPVLEAIRDIQEHEREQAEQIAGENRAKSASENVDVSTDFLRAIYDQRDITKRSKVKWYDPNTQIGDRTGKTRRTKKRGVCFHHTAVLRGFGADKSLVKKYIASPMDVSRFITTNRALTHMEWARAMALAHRYRGDPPRKHNEGVPYHAIMGANSVLYLNLPFDWVTWHGNASNTDFLGVAWDALSTREDPDADDLIADGVSIIELARAEGHPIDEITVHAAYTRKPDDPGKVFIQRVMLPLASHTGCKIDMDFEYAKNFRSIREILAS
jgi:hypothetical protein